MLQITCHNRRMWRLHVFHMSEQKPKVGYNISYYVNKLIKHKVEHCCGLAREQGSRGHLL